MPTFAHNNSLTAVSATATIIIPDVAPAGHIFSGEFLDNAYTTGDLVNKELKQTLQGVLKAGYIPQIKEVTITLLPGTPSHNLFIDWYQAEENVRGALECESLVITLPAIKSIVTYTNGFLATSKAMPDVKKILQEVSYKISFGKVVITQM